MRKLGRKLSEKEAMSVFAKIVSGVEHLHQSKMIHRDLKLENIMVNYDETTMKMHDLCISDFGFCKLMNRNE